MYVLIVDDELSIRETFQAFLEEEGYGVTTAADFFEAESFLADHPCDVVVADIILPRVNGLALLQRVREIDEDIPVVVVTGEPDVATATEAVRYGAYDYIAKPVTQEVLTRVVGRAVERKRLLDERRRLEAENRNYQAGLERRVAERTAELEQRNRELAALIEIGRDISATLDLTKVLERVTQRAAQVCKAHRCTILLLAEDGKVAIPLMSQFSDGYSDREMWRLFEDMRYPVSVSQVPEAQRVIRERHPLFIPDASASSLPRHLIETFGIKSVLLVPLVSKERVIGLMAFDRVEGGREFTSGQVDLAMATAAQAAVAIENARLFEETNRRLADTRLIQEVMLAAASTLDFDLVLERTVKALHRALGIDRLGFLLPDEQSGTLISHPSLVGFAEATFQIPIDGTLVGRAYRTGQPVLVRDLPHESGYSEYAPETCSILAVPVRVGDHIAAVLHTESPQPGAFGENELLLFATIAGQLGATLENAHLYQELQEINRLRAELLQNVGHELRTPLGLIKGYVGLLLEGDLGPILDSQRSALQVIRERTATLSRLIQNLTALQALPGETRVLVSVVEIMQRALAEFRRSAEEGGITIVKELPVELPPVSGDREQLELAFGHLLDNAIKFSPDGGTVTMSAWADQEMVYVSIADEGIGISAEYLDRIFERFYQVDGTTRRRFGGMGVGLALVLEIVEAHDGTVEVRSEPGEGSTFTVALPQAKGAT